MNYQVNVEGKNPAEVARTFLIDEGLIKEGQE
jgi:osmoprotectant transport system permease protein